jgi:uncharacterized damage-inducible protein DinB
VPMNQALLPEFDHEMANSRKALERVPDGKFDWKPHQKSMSLGQLAAHIASIPSWAAMTMTTPELDVRPVNGPAMQQPQFKTRAELLSFFDKSVGEARTAITTASDETLMAPWSLLSAGKPIFKMPRIGVLRGMIMNHMIHHRGQLGVYLRLNDVPVPSLYGPSADEGGM